jgi:nucleotide-binding universal stress UspA family protein
VLVTRTADGDFPRLVAVGVDGSVGSRTAYRTARYVAERFGSAFFPLAAWGGDPLDPELVAAVTRGEHHESPESATEALMRTTREADLVVLGAHGLHRRLPLGSVSEHVASNATCSTLVVREPTMQPFGGTLPPL